MQYLYISFFKIRCCFFDLTGRQFVDIQIAGWTVPICRFTSLCQVEDGCSSVYSEESVTCKCDPACVFFRDCCVDYKVHCAPNVTQSGKFVDATEGISSDRLSCIAPPQLPLPTDSTGYLLVDICDATWRNEITRALCEEPGKQDDLYSLTPVSYGDQLSFKNVYCAICNRKSISGISAWPFEAQCDFNGTDVRNDTTDDEMIMFLMSNCSQWYFVAPPSDSTAGRRCNKELEDTCDDGNDTDSVALEDACYSFVAEIEYFGGAYPVTYRNPLCILCSSLNGNTSFSLPDSLINCPLSTGFEITPGVSPPLSVLIDFTSFDNEGVYGDHETNIISCDETEVFDPFLAKCISLSCPNGYQLLNRSCVLDQDYHIGCLQDDKTPSVITAKCEQLVTTRSECAPSWYLADELSSWINGNIFSAPNLTVVNISVRWQNLSSTDQQHGSCNQATTLSANISRNFSILKTSLKNVSDVVFRSSENKTCQVSEIDITIGCLREEDLVCSNGSITLAEFETSTGNETTFYSDITNASYGTTESLYTLRFDFNRPVGAILFNETLQVCVRPDPLTCPMVKLNASLFHFVNNSFIYHLPSNTRFGPEEFVLTDEGTVKVCSFYENDDGMLAEDRQSLAMITFVGCLLSITSLILTVGTYLMFKSLRKSVCGPLIMSICVSLLLAQVILLSSNAARSNDTACTFVAVIGHYMWLTVFSHSVSLALDLYRRFGITRRVQKTSEGLTTLLKFLAFAWGFPLLIVLPCLVIYLSGFKYIFAYGTEITCWIGYRNAIIYAFILPIALSLIVNGTLFILVIIGLRERKTFSKKSNTQQLMADLVIYVKVRTVIVHFKDFLTDQQT